MKVLVIGLGSMGKRRIRLLQQLDQDHVIYGVDARADRREEAAQTFGITTFSSIEDAVASDTVDCAFVSTAPLAHSAVIHTCLRFGLHVFTEINLVADGYEQNMALAKQMGKVLFLSSSFLYREEVRYIRQQAAQYPGKLNYIYHVGQYLPDWHPWESYQNFFVGDKRTNGCREIYGLELPWITEAFGPIRSICSLHDRNSSLNLNYDDNYQVQILHENGNKGVFCVDIVCPHAVRNLEVYGEHFYLSWNGTPNGLHKYEDKTLKNITLYDSIQHQQGYQATIVENMYTNEIKAFFDAIENSSKPIYDFEKDKVVLNWIDKIEEEI